MSGEMRPYSLQELLARGFGEYSSFGSIFDIPKERFHRPRGGPGASSGAVLGPAAGPHTQLAQNLLSAWLAGARYFELKTVQKLDRLAVEKPCIDAADECYNTEWSTELTLDQAFDEYLKAWILLHIFDAFLNPEARDGSPDFAFVMSVGYDLAGIKTRGMDKFIERLKDSSGEPLFHEHLEEIRRFAEDPRGIGKDGKASLRVAAAKIQPRICSSVTLSTMHGCPPGEIEDICAYLMEEKGLDTLVKLNPTLLGYEKVQRTLCRLGFEYVSLKEEGFAKDLQYGDAVPMLSRLVRRARKAGRSFGVKLSNTLAAVNTRGALPGGEMYMSGRALYPLTLELAAAIAGEFRGKLPISFSGGVSAWNLGALLDAGIGPVTLATDLLKPGGYARLGQLALIVEEHAAAGSRKAGVDAEVLRVMAEEALKDPRLRKDFRGAARVAAEGPLPIWDCFTATCARTCPIAQDVPEYIRLAETGRFPEAFAVIHEKNPLPFMTGYLCDHQCTGNCARLDWEGAVRIRDVKRICAEKGYAEFRGMGRHLWNITAPRGVKAAIVGAGPAGLAAAAFLAREGIGAHVFERESEPGGVVRYLLPGFRVPADAVEKDVSLIRDLGVSFHFGETSGLGMDALKTRGFRHVLVAIGAGSSRSIGIQGAVEALAFLKSFRGDPSAVELGGRVVVIGAGDTAMDAARAAKRCPGVREVRIVYRRSRAEMPASSEEYESARDEGILFDFLLSPEARTAEGLECRVMEMGPADESGRARPVPTSRTRIIPADSIISAAGAEPDTRALSDLGIDAAAKPRVNPETQETSIDGVYLIGDAAEGAQTIVKAIASARRAVDHICLKEGGILRRPAPLQKEDRRVISVRRGGLLPSASAGSGDDALCATEAARCLSCQSACLKCVEVCPNRANTIVEIPGFRDAVQIVHLDAPCNECGNCATFCPWNGKPYRDKLTVYADAASFAAGENPGFYVTGGAGGLRLGERAWEFVMDGSSGIPPTVGDERARSVISVIRKERPWLLGGSR
jgi:putative selenate reductase